MGAGPVGMEVMGELVDFNKLNERNNPDYKLKRLAIVSRQGILPNFVRKAQVYANNFLIEN